jgi:hypothetical protein
MKRRTLRDFHNELSWNTKIYTLLAISVLLLARFTSALTTDFAVTIVLGLLVILFVESFAIISFNHPGAWVYVKWVVILLVLAFVLLGWAKSL